MSNKHYEGWGRPQASRKFHYFKDSIRSICNGWVWFGAVGEDALEIGMDSHKENCVKCQKIKLKENKK